ncbi:MAG: hypothetical protein BMS9Abin26_0260 [Gammaproteobacteria bacterium]|nr:MAG: hypothetical protein BMS9Abin26_0260 [Gammaproteobacteria bacterium]
MEFGMYINSLSLYNGRYLRRLCHRLPLNTNPSRNMRVKASGRYRGAVGTIVAGPATYLLPLLTILCHRSVTSACYTGSHFEDKAGLGAMAGEHMKVSFVARIWLEPGNNGAATWRGHIQHVQGKEEEYFQDLMEMREFLGRVSGTAGPPVSAQPLKDVTKSEPGTVTNMKQKD